MKLFFFFIIILFFPSVLFSQKHQKFELKIIKCDDCARHKPEIDKILKEGNNIVEVFNKIKVYFNPNYSSGDAFTLKCDTCDPGLKFLKFPSRLNQGKKEKSFVTKGDDLVFFSDLQDILSSSLVIIDSAGLNLTAFTDKSMLEPFDLRVEYFYKSELVRRSLTYSKQKEALFIIKNSLFGQLPQKTIDTLSVSVYYYNSNAEKIKLNRSFFKPHFLSPEELNDLKEYVRLLKQDFPELNEAGIISQLITLLNLNYSNVIKENITEWLKNSHL
jgi:hypothetical protein